MKWFPKNKGLANGLIFCGYGSGSVIFNYIVTFIVNPDNEPQVIDPTGQSEVHFHFLQLKLQDYYFPAHVAARLPKVFKVLAICFVFIQAVGILCIIEPNEKEMAEIEKEAYQHESGEKHGDDGMDPINTLKRWKFWQVWLSLLCLSMVNIYISSFYKVCGFVE